MRMSWGWVRQLPPKRTAIVTAVVAVVASGVYVAFRLRGMDIETPVSLPFAHAGDVVALENPHFVHLTNAGQVLLGNRRVSLNDLAAAIADDTRPIVLCADQDAPVLHLWYVQDICKQHDAYIAVDDGWRTAVIPANSFGPWKYAEAIMVGFRAGEFVVAHYGVRGVVVDDVPDAIDRIQSKWDDARDAYESGESTVRPLHIDAPCCEVDSLSNAPVGVYVKALDVAYGLGWTEFRTRCLAADPWTRGRMTLPAVGPDNWFVLDHWTHFAVSGLPPLELPVARNSLPAENDKRLEFWISDDGDLHLRGKRHRAREFSSILEQQTVLYDRRMKRIGQPPHEGRSTPVPVWYRMGRNTPWERARALFRVAHDAGYSRQQLVVRTWVDFSWSASERMVVGRASDQLDAPPPIGLGEQLFPVPGSWPADGQHVWFGVHVLEPTEGAHASYRIADEAPTGDIVERNKQLLRHAGTKCVRLTIDPSVKLWRAVEMIDVLRGLGHTVQLEP